MPKKDFFSYLGVSKKEKELYLLMLRLGAQPISVVAKRFGIPRSSMYVILERLKSQKVVEEFERFGKKYVAAVSPQEIQNLFEKRKSDSDLAIQDLQSQLSELEGVMNTMSLQPKVEFFEGKSQVLRMYEQVAQYSQISSIVNLEAVEKYIPQAVDVVAKGIDRGVRAREIVVGNTTGIAYQKKHQKKHHQIRLLDPKDAPDTDVTMGEDKVVFVSYSESGIMGTQIHNQEIVQTQKILFEALWSKLK